MTTQDFLVKTYDKQRLPYEDRGKEYDKLRKRRERQRELEDICDDLFIECEKYKKLQLTDYQKRRVIYLVNNFGKDFKRLHGTAKKEAIILSFIFYIKINELGTLRLNEYKLASQYGLNDNIFEIIVCRLCEHFMSKMPIVPYTSTSYDHEILSKNGGIK